MISRSFHGGHVTAGVNDRCVDGRSTINSTTARVYAIALRHLWATTSREHGWVRLGCSGVRIVARDVRIIATELGLGLVSTVLSRRADVAVREVARVAVFGNCEHPVMVAVKNSNALSLSHGELLVATRRIVADCGHPQISGSVLCGTAENLTLQGAVICDIARLVGLRLVSRRLGKAASTRGVAASTSLLRVWSAVLGRST